MIEGEIETKGRNRRRVPIASVLREHLLSHLMRSGRRGDQLVFGVTERSPLSRGGSRSAQTRRGRRLSSTGSSCMSAATLSPQSGIAGMYNI